MDLFSWTNLSSSYSGVLAILGLLTGLYLYIQKKLSYWESQGVAGPKHHYPFADISQLFRKPLHQIQWDNYCNYGSVHGGYSGLKPVLTVGHSEKIKEICLKEFHSFPEGFTAASSNEIEQNFLSSLWGEKWKRVRSLLSPTFTSGKMKGMFNLLKLCIDQGMKELGKSPKETKNFDPKEFWGKYNLDVIAKCCFAVNLNPFKDDDNVFVKNFREFFRPEVWRFAINAALPKWLVYRFQLTVRPSLYFFRDITVELVKERKAAEDGGSRVDFLQLMLDSEASPEELEGIPNFTQDNDNDSLKSQKKLTTTEIVASSVIFLIAGYETTSTLLNWACYRLAMNPEIQEKLYEEVANEDIHDYETLMSLPYLEAVIKETLRIDPPVVLFQRVAHQDHRLSGSIEIKKGTTVIIPVYAIHHDERNYPEPERFNPDRFLPENKDLIKPYTFLPFGAGPKHCVGMRFALLNAKLALSEMVRKFQLLRVEETLEKVKHDRGTPILSAHGLRIGLKPRW